jgi:hypothetical protein
MKARELAIAGLLVALQILTLLLAYVLPTIKLALLFAACLYSGVLLRIGIKYKVVLLAYVSSVVLTVFIIQIPQIQVTFAAFFGWYGILHEATKSKRRVKQQSLRWLGFATAAATLYVLITYVVHIELEYALWLMALLGAAAFIAMQLIYEFAVREFVKISKISYSDGRITFKRQHFK